jgi:hypothetical protein
MEYDDFGRPKKSPPMVTIEKAAMRLSIPVEVLLERAAERRIAIVGRGKRARITEADIDLIRKPVIQAGPVAPRLREFASERSVGRLIDYWPNGKVVPYRPKPKR